MSHSIAFIKVPFLVGSIAVLLAFSGPFGRNGTSGSFPASPAQLLETFTVESASNGTFPFDRMIALPDGVGNGVTIDPDNTNVTLSQAECVTLYPSGSCRLSQVAGIATLSAGVPLEIDVYSGQQSQGTALTVADIDAAAPTAVIDLDTYGTVSLAALDLTSPVKVWYAGPVMITAEYQAVVSTDLRVKFFVSLFSDGRIRVDGTVANTHFGAIVYTDVNSGQTLHEKDFIPDFSVGGTTVWDNGGANYHMYEFTMIYFGGWIGGDPDLEIIHDVDALVASKMVPPYYRLPTEARQVEMAAATTYVPGARGAWPLSMGAGGVDRSIGILVEWEANCAATADPRACDYAEAMAFQYLSFPLYMMDENTGEPVKPTDRPYWTAGGYQQSTLSALNSGTGFYWEIAHHPAAAYVPYLLTGNPIFYKIIQHTAATNWLQNFWFSSRYPEDDYADLERRQAGQVRSRAWVLRSNGYAAATARTDDPIGQEYLALLENNVNYMFTESQRPGQNQETGYWYGWTDTGECWTDTDNNCLLQSFMQDFLVAATGLIDELNVLSDETNLHTHMDTAMNPVLYRGGGGGANDFCYNIATVYEMVVAHPMVTDIVHDTTLWDLTPKEIYDRRCNSSYAPITCDAPLTACEPTYRMSTFPTGYLGNMMAGLYYALQYSGTQVEAQAVLNRFKNDTRWAEFSEHPTADIQFSLGGSEFLN